MTTGFIKRKEGKVERIMRKIDPDTANCIRLAVEYEKPWALGGPSIQEILFDVFVLNAATAEVSIDLATVSIGEKIEIEGRLDRRHKSFPVVGRKLVSVNPVKEIPWPPVSTPSRQVRVLCAA